MGLNFASFLGETFLLKFTCWNCERFKIQIEWEWEGGRFKIELNERDKVKIEWGRENRNLMEERDLQLKLNEKEDLGSKLNGERDRE